jgi:hypothetical protein
LMYELTTKQKSWLFYLIRIVVETPFLNLRLGHGVRHDL